MGKQNKAGMPYVAGPRPVNIPSINNPDLSFPHPNGAPVKGYESLDEMSQRFIRESAAANEGVLLAKPNRLSDISKDLTGRYETIIPGANNEDIYGQNQSFGSKMVNGVAKGVILAGTTFAQTTVGAINGLQQWAETGKFSSFYDNEFNRKIDEITKASENYLPNYYTDVEKNAHWYSPDKLLTGNFLFDGVVKNLGFAAGAALSGMAFTAGLKALPLTARLFSAGKGLETLVAAEEGMMAGNKSAQIYNNIKAISDTYVKSFNTLNKGGRAVVAGLSTSGEAGFEAYQNLNEYRNERIQQYKDANFGAAPTGATLDKINADAADVGNYTYALNTAILSVSNYVQFPRILGSTYKGEKGLINSLKREINPVEISKDGIASIKKARTRVNQVLRAIGRPLTYTFSGVEALEEGSQFAISIGTQDYVDKRNLGKESVIQSIIEGVKETATTDEGMSNFLIGGLSGGIMTFRNKLSQNAQKNKNTAEFISGVNTYKISDFSKETFDSVVRGNNIQEERTALTASGDKFGSKNAEADFEINYLMPRIKFGRMDLVKADIEDYLKQASTEKGFGELIEEGKVLETEDRLSYITRLQNFAKTAETMESLYQSITLRYGGEVDAEGKNLYTPAVLEKMMYAGSKIDNLNKRIINIIPTIPEVDAYGIVRDIVHGDDTSYEKAMLDLENSTTLTPEQVTTAQENLTDLAQMGLYKEMYTNEYKEFRDNPINHQDKPVRGRVNPDDPEERLDENGNVIPVETITLKTARGDSKLIIGEEYYLGRTVHKSEKGHDMFYFPRLTILGENEDGTIKIKDKNGERDVAPNVLESYKLGRVSSTDSNKKAKFYMDNINTPFFFKFKKENGGKTPGRLEYNPEDGVMDFVYLDKRTKKEKRIEVTGQQFKPKKGYKEALITPGKELTLAEQKQLDDFIEDASTDPRIAEKNEKRYAILMELYEDVIRRKDKFAKTLEAKQEAIVKIKEQLNSLGEVVANTPTDKRATNTVKFKKAARVAIATSMKLSETLRQLENEVEIIETQQEEIEATIIQIEDLADTLDEMPTSTFSFIKELKEEINNLEDLHKSNAGIMAELAKLINITKRAIQSSIDFLSNMITSFENKYPKVPRVMGQDWVDFLKDNPNFLKLHPTYREELLSVDMGIANIEDETITPNEKRLTDLLDHVDLINGQLQELEKEIKVKKIILYRFNDVLSKHTAAQAQKEVIRKNGEFTDDLHDSLDGGVQTTEAYEEHEDFEEANKKNDLAVVTSGIASTDSIKKGNESAKRAQRFGNRLPKLKRDKTFKGRLVTYLTEPYILEGILEKLFPGSAIDEKEKMIAILVTDAEGNPVDEFGNMIPKDVSNAADLAIYQVMPSDKLEQLYIKEGKEVLETMFRESTDKDERARLKTLYGEWREALLADTEIAPLRDISASFGHLEEGKTPEDRTDVQSAGLITTDMLLDTNVIEIATNSTTVTRGSFSLKTELGMVFLALPNALVKLYNRKHTQREAQVIFSAIQRLAQLGEEAGLKGAEANQIFTWLKSVVYWGIAKNTQTGVRKETHGKNNIWFENNEEGEARLHVAGENYPFTYTGLAQHKQIILNQLLSMYGNTHASYIQKSLSTEYVEILGFNADNTREERVWRNYQSYLLSDKLPDEEGNLTIDRPKEYPIPLNVKARPLEGPEDFNRSRIYFTISDDLDQYKKPEEEVKAEEIVKTSTEGETTTAGGFNFDGKTVNTLKLGDLGSADFTVDLIPGLVSLSKFGLDVLTDMQKTIDLVNELISEKILVISPPNKAMLDALTANGIDIEALSLHIGQQVITAMLPHAVGEEIKEENKPSPVAVNVPAVAESAVVTPAVPEVTTVEPKEFILDGITSNTIKVFDVEPVEFTLDEKVVLATLKADPASFEGAKEQDSIVALYNNGLVIKFSESNTAFLTRINNTLETAANTNGTVFKELTPEDFALLASTEIIRTVLPQIKEDNKPVAVETVIETVPEEIVAVPEVIEAVPVEEIVEEITEEIPVEEEIDSVIIIPRNGAAKQNRRVYRTISQKQIEQFDEEVWETLAPELEAMLPQIPVFRTKNIIQATNGREAWGMFRDGAIYIYKNAEKGTGYHEVFEAIWAMFTDIPERNKLIAEFRSRPGTFIENGTMEEIEYKNATIHQAKEEMAEEFRRYRLDKKTKPEKSFLRKLFDDMIAFFEGFLFGKDSANNIEKLFDKIGNGYYAKYNQYQTALSIANRGVIDIDVADVDDTVEFRIKNLSAKIEHELFQHMTFVAISSLVQANDSFFNITKGLNGTSLYNTLHKDILGDPATGELGIIDWLYDDVTTVLAVNKSAEFVKKRAQEVLKLKQEITLSWPEIVKQHKKYLLAYSITFDENDEAFIESEENVKGDYTESNKIDGFKRASAAVKMLFATIPDSTIGEEGIEYVKSSINGVTFVGTEKVFNELMHKLHDSLNISDMLKKLEELSAKDINYATIYKRLTKRVPNSDEELFVKVTQDDFRLITSFWQVIKKQNPDTFTVFNIGDEVVIGDTNLTDAAKQNKQTYINAIIESIREGSSKYFQYNDKTGYFNPTNALLNLKLDDANAEAAAVFLKNLGIIVDGKLIEKWKNTDKDSIRSEFIAATKGVLTSLKEFKDVKYLNNAAINSNATLLKIGSISAAIKTPIFESVYYNLEREKVQTYIGPNYSSYFYDNFAVAKNLATLATGPLKYLMPDGDVFSQGSVVMKKVFNFMSGRRIENTENIMKVFYVNGTIDENTGESMATSGLSYSQRLAQEINLNLSGKFLNLVPGDAELEWGITLFEKGSEFVPVNTLDSKSYLNIFKNYFISEVKLSAERRTVAAGRDNKDLRFFKEILGNDLHKKIINQKGKLSAEQLYTEYEKEIKKAVEAYINKSTAETKELLERYNLIIKTEEGYFTRLGFPSKEMTTDVMNAELKALTINYIIANTELHKLIYSDPYQYSDELKRIKNYNSPRVTLADSPEINKVMHDLYNKDYTPDSLGYSDMNRDHFRTITFEEINAVQGVIEGVESIKEYTEVKDRWKEGDGGGFITQKAKRILELKASNWTEDNERQYAHDIIYEEIVMRMEAARTEEERANLQKELDTHEANNPEINSTYTPAKPIAAGNKANGRKYNDQLLDKYALFTLSFRLLHKINPNSDAIKLYKKMNEENIDYGVFPSARKVGIERIVPLYDSEGNFDEAPFESVAEELAIKNNTISYKTPRTITNIPFKILGIQTSVPSKDEYKGTQGSQVTKLVTMDFREGGVPIDYIPANTEDGKNFDTVFISWMKLSETEKKEQSPLYREIDFNKNVLEARVQNGYEEILRVLGIEEIKSLKIDPITNKTIIVDAYKIADREKLVSSLEEELLKQTVNNNIMDAFESFREEGATVILEATPAYQQIRNILYSISRSRMAHPKVKGGQKVQMFSALLLSNGREIKEETKNGKTYLVSDDLKFYTRGENGKNTNVMEIMVSRWFDSPLSDEELLKFLNETDEGKRILKGVDFRIPTQKQNSIDAFVIKGFLPREMGDSVVLPSEIVKKAGSDFDIDKLSMYLKQVFLNKKGEPQLIKFLDATSSIEERYIRWINENAVKDTKKYIAFLSKDETSAINDKFKEFYKDLDTKYKTNVHDKYLSNFQEFSEVLEGNKKELFAAQDKLMKGMFTIGKRLYRTLSPEVKEHFEKTKKKIFDAGLQGPAEIEQYNILANHLINTKGYKKVSAEDKDTLSRMSALYVLEMQALGETAENINKAYAEALAQFRESKDDIKAYLDANIKPRQEEVSAERAIEINAQNFEKAKEIAVIDGLPSVEEFSKFSIFKQNTRAALDNAYIESLEKLITHPANFDNLVKPNSAKTMEKLSDDIKELLGVEKIDYSKPDTMLNRELMSGLRYAFVTGKKAIGTAAVGQTNNALNQGFLTFLDTAKLTTANFSAKDLIVLSDGEIKFAPGIVNTVTVDGKTYPTLSKIKDAVGNYISDTIGMFIDGYVDISKGPWIMELGATPNTAGTWLFLVKLGVPIETVAYFMNQPAIRELIKQSEISGMSIYKTELIAMVQEQFSEELDRDQVIPSLAQLKKTIKKGAVLTEDQKSQQVFMMYEFLKYSKMASQLYEVVQATNVDTANINDPMLLFKKEQELIKARRNMISSMSYEDGAIKIKSAADAILESSFVGELYTHYKKIREGHSLILLSDKPRLRAMIENILKGYVNKSDKEFVRISQGIVSDLFDWAVHTNMKFSNTVKKVMLGNTKEESAAKQIIDFKDSIFGNEKKGIAPKLDHALYGNYALEAMVFIPGSTNTNADNINIVGRDKVYDQNRVINSFDEMREYFKGQNDLEFYGKIVRLAIMQSGLSFSKISFSRLLPYNDFREVYNSTLSNLETLENLENFEKLGVYERVNYRNTEVVRRVPVTRPFNAWTGRTEEPRMYSNLPKVFKEAVSNNVLPRMATSMGDGNTIMLTWKETISKTESARRARIGDKSHFKSQLMRRVYRDEAKTIPLIHKVLTKKKINKKPVYLHLSIYTAMNAWGDSYRANEFYDYKTIDNGDKKETIIPASIFNNGIEKAERVVDPVTGKLLAPEVTDAMIVAMYDEAYPDAYDDTPIVPNIEDDEFECNI